MNEVNVEIDDCETVTHPWWSAGVPFEVHKNGVTSPYPWFPLHGPNSVFAF